MWPLALEGLVPLRRRRRGALVARTLEAPTPPTLSTPVPFVVVAVYRRANASSMRALLNQLGGEADVRLWALDDVHPALARWTIGRGPAAKFALINRLCSSSPIGDGAFVAVADDDVCLASGSLVDCIAQGRSHDLDLFQPSHDWSSIFTYPMLLRRPWLQARRTTFVECGPLFVISPAGRSALLPLPEDVGMGWGIEVDWNDRAGRGLRMGVIDACPMLHLNPVGIGYDRSATKDTLEAALASRGLRSVYQLMAVEQRWRRGTRGSATT